MKWTTHREPTMRERPILFSGPMVRAILDGRKTQTRRAVKITARTPGLAACLMPPAGLAPRPRVAAELCPYGQIGDRLWVRETWQHEAFPHGPYDVHGLVYYRADYLEDPHGPDGERSPEGRYRMWRPAIHMPRRACRILLEITAVRVERLWDISASDCVAEGVANPTAETDREWSDLDTLSVINGYKVLWEQINGIGAWSANPWVWVLEFRRVDHA